MSMTFDSDNASTDRRALAQLFALTGLVIATAAALYEFALWVSAATTSAASGGSQFSYFENDSTTFVESLATNHFGYFTFTSGMASDLPFLAGLLLLGIAIYLSRRDHALNTSATPTAIKLCFFANIALLVFGVLAILGRAIAIGQLLNRDSESSSTNGYENHWLIAGLTPILLAIPTICLLGAIHNLRDPNAKPSTVQPSNVQNSYQSTPTTYAQPATPPPPNPAETGSANTSPSWPPAPQ